MWPTVALLILYCMKLNEELLALEAHKQFMAIMGDPKTSGRGY